MHGNDFDGSAAFAGGGFMPSQVTQNTDPIPFTKNRDTQTLIPLTVNQITKALLSNDDRLDFLIDGVDINNVKLVGMVLNRTEGVSHVSFVLDDGTGRIDCHRWTQEPVDTKEMESILEGMYVRVHGQLKGLQAKRQLVVFGIKPVTDFDEITHHFVECIYVHSYNTKLMKQRASSSNQTHMPRSAANTQAYLTTPANQFTGQYVADELQGIEKTVSEYLAMPANLAREAGVHEDELVKQLGVPKEQIRKALNVLVDEGLVYSSVDEHHFKSAANA